MSHGLSYMHSHSALERELRFPKHIVLVDACFRHVFENSGYPVYSFMNGHKEYCKVPIMAFVEKGGVFKNLSE